MANLPSPEGRALGREIARMADAEMLKPEAVGARCPTCACRHGTFANGCAVTLMSFLKCTIERSPFICHEDDKPCRGWLAMRADQPGIAPWDHVGGTSDPGWGKPPSEAA